MNYLEKPTLGVVCGSPMAGKSSVAMELAKKLGVHHLDIDENIRLPIFGRPHPHPEESEELKRIDDMQMRKSYDLFFEVMDVYMGALKQSLIVTATFSSKIFGQDRVGAIIEKNQDSRLKVIWCRVLNDAEAEIKRRLSTRQFGINYFGATNSYERWKFLEGRYNPIELPHLLLDTSPPNTVQSCAESALTYMLG